MKTTKNQGRHLERRLCEVRIANHRDLLKRHMPEVNLQMSPVSLGLNAQEISPVVEMTALIEENAKYVSFKTTTKDNKT